MYSLLTNHVHYTRDLGLYITNNNNNNNNKKQSSNARLKAVVSLVSIVLSSYGIGRKFGGDNAWRNWFDKGFCKKVWSIGVQSNCYVICMWSLDGFSLAELPNLPILPPAKHSHYTVYEHVKLYTCDTTALFG